MSGEDPCPPYTYVPGGPWPHPTSSPEGHSFGHNLGAATPIDGDDWANSPVYLRGIALFNAGYYWEAHEVWESLWHGHGRRGPTADIVKGLILLAAAGVKVRQGQLHGITTHARRAAELFERVANESGRYRIGLDLVECAARVRGIVESPPVTPTDRTARVSRVFSFQIEPDARMCRRPDSDGAQ